MDAIALVLGERPWQVKEEDSLYKIEGTLHTEKGGVALIHIDKKNAQVVKVIHGK